MFGRAFGALPESARELSAEAARFVEQAVAGLAQDGKVIPVRLALFAEMMKDRPWTPAALRAVGGATGVGVAFLEETFSAAAYGHLGEAGTSLSPEGGAGSAGSVAAGAGDRHQGADALAGRAAARAGYAWPGARTWERLLRILDGELRLVTPTDPERGRGTRLRVSRC